MGRLHNEIERFTHAGRTVVICADPEASSPRDNDGNLCRIVHWHRESACGDEDVSRQRVRGDFKSAEAVKEFIEERAKQAGDEVIAILPVWIYEHSGITLRASAERPGYPFTCPWDAGQVGWAYVTMSVALKAGCVPGKGWSYVDSADVKHVGVYDKAWFEKAITDEVALFDKWANGGFTGYVVLDEDGDHLDSCWGYDDEDYCREEAKSAAESARSQGQVDGACDARCE